VLLAATTARADDLYWREEWPHFRTAEYVATSTMGASVVALYLMPRVKPRWGAPILFDGPVRDALRASTPRGKSVAATFSTIAYWGMLIEPIVAQGPVVPLLRGSPEVGAQVTLINLQSLALSAFLFRASEVLIARARPYVWECIEREGSAEKCREHGVGGTNSFISGHAAIAATGAALICTNQFHTRMYGSVGGPITCGVGIALAMTAGIGRIVSDNHYATDVIAGWMVGVLSGYLLPSLLHYGFDGEGVGSARTSSTGQPVMISFAGAL
jgi:membrane-associated phospholipid phosphatase